jgi:hypothetical protein
MEQLGILSTLASTCINIENTLAKYNDFIKVIFLSNNLPNSVSTMPTMYRKVAIISDTDSTIYTVQDWNKWYNNGIYNFNINAERIAHCITYIATASLTHNLMVASANMGMKDKRLTTMSMKSEFYFPVMVPASGSNGPITKHYFASIAAQEGNIKDEYDYEIKGVALKSSAVSKEIIKDAQSLMKKILNIVMSNNLIEIVPILKEIADKERAVISSITNGDTSYFRKSKVKSANAYSDDEDRSPYSRYKFWVDVFEEKYGKIDPPPFGVVKIPTTLSNKTELAAWVNSIRDEALKGRLAKWLVDNNKKDFPTIYISTNFASSRGLPEELVNIIDYKRIILDIFNAHYIAIASLGYMKSVNGLLSDIY